MPELPIVGRNNELKSLTQAVTESGPSTLYPVIGPSGIGKSTMLDVFAARCETRGVPIVHHQLQEPKSAEQFLARLLNEWETEYPDTFPEDWRSAMGELTSTVGETISTTPGTGMVTNIAGVALRFLGKREAADEGNEPDLPAELRAAAQRTKATADANQFVLIIDQFDKSRLEESVYEDIARILREFAQGSDGRLACCVGTQERFYDQTATWVSELELTSFDVDTVRTYLEGTTLDATKATEVHEASGGNPYFVERIVTIGLDSGSLDSVLADLSSVEHEQYRWLEERFLQTLDAETQQLLAETCALPELNARTVAYVMGEDESVIEGSLSSLERQAVVTRVGYQQGRPTYRLHNLQRRFLLERTSEDEEIAQHSRMAAYYAEETVRTQPGSLSDWIAAEDDDRLQTFISAGILFEYHIQQLPRRLDAQARLERAFDALKSVDESSAREVLSTYFSQYRHLSLGVGQLGVEPDIDSSELSALLQQDTNNSQGPQVRGVYQRIRDSSELNESESKLVILLIDSVKLWTTKQPEDGESVANDVLPEVRDRIERIRGESYSDAAEVQRLVETLLVLLYRLICRQADVESEYDRWEVIEAHYGLTSDDWEHLYSAITSTFDLLLDIEAIGEYVGSIEESTDGTMATLEGEDPVEEQGLQSALENNLQSPLLMGARALNSPTQKELERHNELWSTLEAAYEDRSIGFIAALCRDVQQSLLEPVTGGMAEPMVAMQLASAFDVHELELKDHQPVQTAIRIGKAIQQGGDSP